MILHVLFAENENDLQFLLYIMNDWCCDWKLKINVDKSKIVHFRNVAKEKTNKVFACGNQKLEIADQYK